MFSLRTEEASAKQYFQFYGFLSQQQNMMQVHVHVYMHVCMSVSVTWAVIHVLYIAITKQGCGNIELTTGHFDLFSSLLSALTFLYTV